MCSLNQLYLKVELHAHSVSRVLWAGPGTVCYWRGHIRCRATGSGSWHLHPWHKLFPSGAKGPTPGSWWAPDRQGPSKQLVTITNSGKEQWMQLFTRAQSKSLLVSRYYACLRSLFYFSGQHGEAVTRAGQPSAGSFHRTRGNPAIHALSPSGLLNALLQPLFYQLHIFMNAKEWGIKQMQDVLCKCKYWKKKGENTLFLSTKCGRNKKLCFGWNTSITVIHH